MKGPNSRIPLRSDKEIVDFIANRVREISGYFRELTITYYDSKGDYRQATLRGRAKLEYNFRKTISHILSREEELAKRTNPKGS